MLQLMGVIKLHSNCSTPLLFTPICEGLGCPLSLVLLKQIGWPLCFENDPFCLSRNPFLLITIWIAYVRDSARGQAASPLVYSLAKERNASLIFSTTCALFAQNKPQRIAPNAFPFMALRTLEQNNEGCALPLPSNACFLPMLFFLFHFQK